METRRCGGSDLALPALGLGCWSFGGGDYWGAQDQRDVEETVRAALEAGVTYLDTAEAYNDGRSEESLGRALRGIPRDRFLVGTKISPGNAYASLAEAHCDASLRRLGLDHVDLYMIHWPIHPHSIRHFTSDEAVISHPPRVAEAVEALRTLQRKGKVRHLGVSNFGPRRMEEIAAFPVRIAVNQLPYNLLCRAVEIEALPWCRGRGIGVIGYMTLLQGVLSDRFTRLEDVPPYRRRTRHFDSRKNPLARHGGEGAEAETEQALREIRRIAAERGTRVTDIALRWALAAQGISCCLAGARNAAQLAENVRAVEAPLDAETAGALNRATDALQAKLGPGMDYYESVENDRTR